MTGLTLEQVNFVDSKSKLNGGVFYIKDMSGELRIFENGANNVNQF
jgi:hypothetical protein